MKARRGHIFVEGHEGEHKVVENLGFNADRDVYAKVVLIDGKDTIVVSRSRSGPWRVNRPKVDTAGLRLAITKKLAPQEPTEL